MDWNAPGFMCGLDARSDGPAEKRWLDLQRDAVDAVECAGKGERAYRLSQEDA